MDHPISTDVDGGIVLTVPELTHQEPRDESEALYVDLHRAAMRRLYAQSQHFASRQVAEAIAMDSAPAPLIETLHVQDTHGRLRLYYLFIASGIPLYVYVKDTIIDGEMPRV